MEAIDVLNRYKKQQLLEEEDRKIWTRCYEYINSRVDGQLGQWKREWRDKLDGKPAITFNEMKKFLNRICGAWAATKMDERCYPRDDDSDPAIAEILTDLLKYTRDLNNADMQIRRAFRDCNICGYGWVKTEFSDEFDEMGEIVIRSKNPFQVWIIERGDYYDLRDTKGLIEELPMSRDEIVRQWPEKEEEISSYGRDVAEDKGVPVSPNYDYNLEGTIPVTDIYDRKSDKFKVLRYQYWDYEKLHFIEDQKTKERTPAQDSQGKKLTKDQAKEAASVLTVNRGREHKVVSKDRRFVNTMTLLGALELENKPLDYRLGPLGFDLTGFFAYTDGGRITGTMQDLLDPQDEKNKRHSQIIHILGTSAKNNYFTRKNAFDDIDAAQKQFGGIGQLIPVNGDLETAVKPIESNLTAVPAIIQMDQQSTAEMKEISGLSDASLGIVPEGVKSGRGINALQGPTETIIAELFDNAMASRKIIAQKTVNLMQQFYTTEKRIRILGDYTKKFVPEEIRTLYDQTAKMIREKFPYYSDQEIASLASQLVDVQNGAKIVTINKQVGEQKLNDITVGQYDVVQDSVAQNPTMRRAQYQDMLNMRALGIPIANELIVKYSDVRGKDEILASMEETEAKMITQQMLAGTKPNTATPPQQPQPEDQMASMGMQF